MSGDSRISALPVASTTSGAELLPLVQGGNTKQIAVNQLLAPAFGAGAVGFTPTGVLISTTVQAAIAETALKALQVANNLSDLANVATARTNLGLTASTGAGFIGAVDGAGGALWTTVQGHITKLISATGAATVGGAAQVVDSITALRALLKTSYSTRAVVTGYYAAGDGGGGTYYLDAADTTSADNGGTIIVATDGGRWKLQITDLLSVEQFGAKGDGVTDDTTAFTNAAAVAVGNIAMHKPSYKLTGTSPLLSSAHFFSEKTTAPTFPNSKLSSVGLFQPGTGTHNAYNASDATQQAVVHRFNDRAFFGGATVNDAQFPNTTKDWLSTAQVAAGYGNGIIVSSMAAFLNSDHPYSNIAATFGSHSLHFTSAASACGGLYAYGLNDNTTLATQAWGIYAEGIKMNATNGSAMAAELDVRTMAGATVHNSPFVQSAQQTVALQLAAGCGMTSVGQSDVTAAIQIQTNPMKFQTGIIFGNGALTLTGGVGEAISLARAYKMQWYASDTIQTMQIRSDTTLAAKAMNILTTDTAFYITDYLGNAAMSVLSLGAAVSNYLQIGPGAAASSYTAISALGGDANINLNLITKGTGLVGFGTYTAGAVAQAGYVTINDSGGTPRRLLVG